MQVVLQKGLCGEEREGTTLDTLLSVGAVARSGLGDLILSEGSSATFQRLARGVNQLGAPHSAVHLKPSTGSLVCAYCGIVIAIAASFVQKAWPECGILQCLK